MRRWLQRVTPDAPFTLTEEAKERIRTGIRNNWDNFETRDEMLAAIIDYFAHKLPNPANRMCLLAEWVYPLIVDVYRELHPEDFEPDPEVPS